MYDFRCEVPARTSPFIRKEDTMVEVRVRNHTDQVHTEAMREKEENNKTYHTTQMSTSNQIPATKHNVQHMTKYIKTSNNMTMPSIAGRVEMDAHGGYVGIYG